MKHLRWVLLPFSFIYGIVTTVRNLLFDFGISKVYPISGKSIVIGNLSVGGTGKTPLVIYLATHFLKQGIPVATLSRGYGRKTKGLITAKEKSTAEEIGDEPRQYKFRFRDLISVTVAEKRLKGVLSIRQNSSPETIILLDDAFQHRKVKAGLNILVTEFHQPFCSDFILPAGRLREAKRGARRADIIIVSKCPKKIPIEKKAHLEKKLTAPGQYLFFSRIVYSDLVHIAGTVPNEIKKVLLVTGIGNPTPLVNHLKLSYDVVHFNYADHHSFSEKDIDEIHQKFNTFASREAIIITTEKDYMRLEKFGAVSKGSHPWFYQPIEIEIEKETQLLNLLNSYVRKD